MGALFKHIHDVLTKLNNWKLTYNCVCMKQTKQISHVLTLTLASFLGKKGLCLLKSQPPKTHTYTHYYLIAFCTQHNFLK